MATQRPSKVVIRAYNVGFGDCLLVSFEYPGNARTRHVLIDCGSTRAPEAKKNKPDFMSEIVADIAEVCGGKLDAVVATHRHRDHISGFGAGTGPALAALNPEVVIQPWTEDPDAPEDALAPVSDPGVAFKGGSRFKAVAEFRTTLDQMHAFAGEVATFGAKRRRERPIWGKQLEFLGEENVANLAAVKNLMKMGKSRRYVYFGARSGLEKLLPGVKTHVLGPPTLKQTDSIRRQAARSEDEFWHLYHAFTSFWKFQAATAGSSGKGRLFRGKGRPPRAAEHWFVDRMRKLQDDSVLSIVTELDKQMNNTSVILLFETGGKRLLFPGDAQLENWLYALQTLESSGRISMIEEVDFYKVGHHGSLNATPMSLWNKFKKRGDKGEMKSVLSTRPGVHGSTAARTEVPRRTLAKELESSTALERTDTIKASDKRLCRTIEIPLD